MSAVMSCVALPQRQRAVDSTTRKKDEVVIECMADNRSRSWVGSDLEVRMKLYKESLERNDAFWSRIAREDYYWHKHWQDDEHVKSFNFHRSKGPIYVRWFEGAMTNVCYNALDRHLPQHRDRVCFYFEGNFTQQTRRVTYGDMYTEVVQLANVLRTQYAVQKGDVVSIYLPQTPFAVAALLACARIGAVASVVFAGFSSKALATRLCDAKPRVLLTADAFFRGEKAILLKNIADEALLECTKGGLDIPCLVYENCERQNCCLMDGRDVWYRDALTRLSAEAKRECPITWMEAEDPLFVLYTSGSTGQPKALLHTTAGYMVYAGTTFKYSFDYHPDDVYFCTADIGWITGHSYVVYGPMLHCATSVLYEGVPTFPSPSRWWELVERYHVTTLYTSPTAIRALMRCGDEPVRKCNRSSLRILGSVGEPINVEAWMWFYEVVGERHVDIVDTWWQSETGGHMITPLPGCTPLKPGSATLPFFGIVPALLEPTTLAEQTATVAEGLLVIRQPWPGMARSIYHDHARFEQTYFSADGYYMTGDGARRDGDGYIWITGRVDDVLNVSGHRIGTSEVEDAINSHHAVVESAVVGVPHDIKGESIYAFVTFRNGVEVTRELLDQIRTTVRQVIGAIATPDHIQPAQSGLPKTRSGKIVRRILRKVACKMENDIGDTSTIHNPDVVEALIEMRTKWVEERV